MTKEAFIKHKDTLAWWSKDESRKVWSIGISCIGEWKLDLNPSWYSDQLIVPNDKYAGRRKAGAEGKKLQVSYDQGVTWYDKLTHKISWSDNQWVRIKPEPTFSVGDWVVHPDGHVFQYKDSQASQTGWQLWKPTEGEWCVFYKSNYKHVFKVAKFMEANRKKYVGCEPFIGTIPDNFKE